MSNNDQNESPLPVGDNNKRKSSELLPRYFRTQANEKILGSTLDQMVQPGVAEKIAGFYGRKTARAFQPGDTYIEDVNEQRQNRQLEPATVVKDSLGNVEFYKDYSDFVNQISAFNGDVSDHSLLNAQEYYAWNPNVDWDKLVNFREYYWLPNGPQTVQILGQSENIKSTYKVTTETQDGTTVYKFSNRLAVNPIITLYRGQTYRFEIDTPGFPFAFTRDSKFTIPDPLSPSENISSQYVEGQTFFNVDGNEVAPQYIENGVIEFTVPLQSPDHLFYLSEVDANTGGFIKVFDIGVGSTINVEEEILGKLFYTSSNGVEFTNGMKITFGGAVTPERYAIGEWYVEGVGTSITLINEADLVIPASFSDTKLVPFDSNPFDRLPFSDASSFAEQKDYLVVNRASPDRNAWSRYNLWFHSSVIEAAARANNQPVVLDQSARATRPIIEFEAGLRLFNYGTVAKDDIDLIDTFTTDVFSTIEGSLGYNVDGTELAQGMRVLFTADPDRLVNGKIFEVNFITIDNNRQISLIEIDDTDPLEGEVVLVTNGVENRGLLYWYDGAEWQSTQQKTQTNQQPLFQLYDASGNSFNDSNVYNKSTFVGNPVFVYKEGVGAVDAELGFPLSYRTIENVGDIQFSFALVEGQFTYQVADEVITKFTDAAYLRKYESRESFVVQNGWAKAFEKSSQAVIRQYVIEETTNFVEVDTYDNSSRLDDLRIKVYLNQSLQAQEEDYVLDKTHENARVVFTNELPVGSNVILKTRSTAPKNNNGYYEIAHNLERNPLNDKIESFTLGEVNDHVSTIVENVKGFDGQYPGNSNLRDLGDLDQYGKRFVQHTGPVNLASYHITDKSANIIKALRFNRAEYAKFKRTFLQAAEELGFDGTPKQQVDILLDRVNANKNSSMPFFFTDMLCTSASRRFEHIVSAESSRFYALTETFTLNELSARSVLVYLNSQQLVHGRDYVFNNEGFVEILTAIVRGDVLEIVECDSTDGSFVPSTPTKLGLYPSFIPQIIEDDTYLESRKVIQGHDGSITLAFNDYRDDIILELELRIYNNIKQPYNTDLLDIKNFVPSDFRTTGYTLDSINNVLVTDFVEWVTIAGNPDYTTNTVYDSSDSFTYNYTNTNSPNGVRLNGYWRSVYIQAYDTDRPHTHPWEMLGFSVMPVWWESVYGPAPYTRNNLVLWEDLAGGVMRDSDGNVTRKDPKYSRPTLLSHIPVDIAGNLLSPADSGYVRNQVDRTRRLPFKFGDHGPVETAWRRSSEYPFSLITAMILNQPNTVFATGFDMSRLKRNQVGQIIYTETGKILRLKDLVFPNARTDNKRTSTSGLVNYIFDYLNASVLLSYETYKDQVTRVRNQLSIKVGGFTEKEKFRLILDSRTPFNEGNVFLPFENYQIFLNTSSPIDVASYSGVIVEKTTAGYIVKGYDRENPVFRYARPVTATNDPVINIGGVSEPFTTWAAGKQYIKGKNVRNGNQFYRVLESHVSGSTFDPSKFRKVNSLPQQGGQDAVLRRRFEDEIISLPYGTLLPTTQDVVDFLLGYEEFLVRQGFIFDLFNSDISQVENWTFSVKEFLFWTTQNWAPGSAITLSPAAEQVKFARDFSVVDNIFDNFYGYSLYKADGKNLNQEFSSIARSNQVDFGVSVKNTDDGIFHIRLPLVQKEHIILLDNTSVFGDIIYDLEAGYRQERIRVTGYRSDNWNGSLDIPGFIYDSAEVSDWETWTDYSVGSLVKYKEFFYVALNDVPGSNVFVASNWERLDGRPESRLIPNFNNRINQFADFYDLDTDNFDTQQQQHAQHLIGYQKRNYLQNIITDDVSQYKFYQGFIQDKGTINSLTKLFDALGSADKESLEFYEEWAIRLGRYGATSNSEVVEFLLDEAQFRLDPQPVELTNRLPVNSTDLVYRPRPSDIYATPEGYDSNPFPVAKSDPFVLRLPGFVLEDDISFRISNKNDILQGNIASVDFGDYIWVIGLNEDWDVLQHVGVPLRVTEIENLGDGNVTITFNTGANELAVGDYIGVQGLASGNNFYRVTDLGVSSVSAVTSAEATVEDQQGVSGYVSKLRSVRVQGAGDANKVTEGGIVAGQRIWVDSDKFDNWYVLENQEAYLEGQTIINKGSSVSDFAKVASSNDNTKIVIGDPSGDTVQSYIRANEAGEMLFDAEIVPFRDIANSIDPEQRFGDAVALSPDGKFLAIGSPNASNVSSPLAGDFDATVDYTEGDIVKQSEQYWVANRDLTAKVSNTTFETFNSYAFVEKDSGNSNFKLLLQHAPYLPDINLPGDEAHVLVRAPINQYLGSVPGDRLHLAWNRFTHLNRIDSQTAEELTEVLPFEDVDPQAGDSIETAVSTDFISHPDGHEIIQKVDNVLFVQNGENLPVEGNEVTTTTARGTVYKRYSEGFDVVLYIINVQGEFNQSDTLLNGSAEVGTYTQPSYQPNSELGGYWMIGQSGFYNSAPFGTGSYTNAPQGTAPSGFGISGAGLVFKDLILASETRDEAFFFNALKDAGEFGNNLDRTFLINFSYQGDVQDVTPQPFPDDRWAIRMPVDASSVLGASDLFRLWVNDSIVSEDVSAFGFDINYLNNNEHTINDVWDGYIDFTFTATQDVDAEVNDDGPGDFYEPDGSLGIDPPTIFDPITGATAEVAFYQKRSDKGRIYLKNVSGGFVVNNLLRINTSEDGTPNTREMGRVDYVSLADSELGRLAIVVNPSGDFPVNPNTYTQPLNDFALVNGEYWFYETRLTAGAPQAASFPTSRNKDWSLVSNIPVDPSRASNTFANQGVYHIYARENREWQWVNTYLIPESGTDSFVAKDLDFAQHDQLYTLFVSTDTSVYIIKNGTDQNGITYDWAIDKDARYRGNWNDFETAVNNNPNAVISLDTGTIVEYNGELYQARTVITTTVTPDSAPTKWEPLDSEITVEGFVPHDITSTLYNDNTFTDPSQTEFAKQTTSSQNGQVLVVTVATDVDTALDADLIANRVVIYRVKNGRYVYSQTIDDPNVNQETDGSTLESEIRSGFGDSIALSPNGQYLIIGEPFSDDRALDQGTVYVYKQKDEGSVLDKEFALVQTIVSPRNNKVEKFGFKVAATDTSIAVTSFNGDIDVLVPIDPELTEKTTFDNGFTQFFDTLTDTGSVTIYELVDSTFIYADAFEYDEAKAAQFGENLVATRNHVYVGLPRINIDGQVGALVDYRRPLNKPVWSKIRQSLPVVDLNQIKEVFLYNRRDEQLITYLDYIDVRQGKVAGTVDAQIDFKMFADPARYNVTTDPQLFNETNTWEDTYVGKVWWDLSTARFANPYQGDAVYQSANWNRLLPAGSVDVYEWVESDLLPSEWDEIADTTEGVAQGISGTSLYGDDAYSQKIKYDPVSQTFSNIYYFWVSNKFTLPNIGRRTISVGNMANLIADPNQEGYRFISLMSDNRFVLYNSESLITGTDVVLAVTYYTQDNQEQNAHTEYQLLTEGLSTSLPKQDIERKWVDSLTGYDIQGRKIPDPNLPPRQRYGTLFSPRQSWFVNRQEALKQVIERANISLLKLPVVDSRDLSKFLAEDPIPLVTSHLYDYAVDTVEELRFIGTSKAARASISVEVTDGSITDVSIDNPGRRYKDPTFETGNAVRKGPTVTVNGSGKDLEIDLFINNLGQVTDFDIVDPGTGYTNDVTVTVRPVSALVRSDSTIGGRWAVYTWDTTSNDWSRASTQEFDVKSYWDYVDWFAEGNNQFTEIDHVVQGSFQLPSLDDSVGDVVRIENVGQGGWLLLRKVNDVDTDDITVNYETIGRQDGTIQIDAKLYDTQLNLVGFDAFSYDSRFFDSEPTDEIRLVMQGLKEDILIDDLATDYNELFFSSVRYVFSEQLNVDWAFKTSFVRATHNIGELSQSVTFKNDSLPSFNEYVEEAKPYKTNIREYVSALGKTDDTNSVVTDFDLPPKYDPAADKILPRAVQIVDNQLVDATGLFDDFPDKHWRDNLGFTVTEVRVFNRGTKYTTAPKVSITGGGGSGATARAFVGQGKITKVQVVTAGSGYTSAPTITIDPPPDSTGVQAQASAILGEGLVRSTKVEMKFDRYTSEPTFLTLKEQESLTGTGANTIFNLKWPMDLRTNRVTITVNGEESLRSEFAFRNIKDTTLGYTRYFGQIEFANPPALDSSIVVDYFKSSGLLNATDRIEHLYAPTSGMIGKDLSQLMKGVDYGGVEVKSFDFDTATGWDNDEWFTTTWDTFDSTFEDLVFRLDGSTTVLELDNPLEDGVVYNVYKNGVRIDDPNFGTQDPVTNLNAEMPSLEGDGSQLTIDLSNYGVSVSDGDVFVVRKTTSDGSFAPDPDSFDTQLSGGTLDYGNATGLNAEDIIVDGDLFVTPVASGSLEELIPGQVLDTVDIKVFERLSNGQAEIFNQNYVTDGTTDTYSIGIKPNNLDAVVIKLDDRILAEDEYTVDFEDNTVTLDPAPAANQWLTIFTLGMNGEDVLDINTFVSDGTATEVETNVAWRTDLSSFILFNGVPATDEEAVLLNRNNKATIIFPVAPAAGVVVDYGIFVGDNGTRNFSRVTRDTFVGNGSDVQFSLSTAPAEQEPVEFFMLVNVGGTIVSPGYNKQFIIEDTSVSSYQFDLFQVPAATVDPAEVRVFVDKEELVRGADFIVNLADSSITIDPRFLIQGSIIEAYYTANAEYTVNGDTIELTQSPGPGIVLDVYQFTNHDLLEPERIIYNVAERSSMVAGTTEETVYHNLRGGKILLRSPASGVQYVWVIVNGKLLTPSVDYSLALDNKIVYLVDELEVGDTIDVFHFSAPVATPRMTWSKFKDILNRTHYKRIDNNTDQQLASPLNDYDSRIEMVDASALPEPSKATNRPGVIFVDKERIEYFVKDGNTLRQLRRGTLGTGIRDVYPAGTVVVDSSRSKSIPYKDETISQVIENDGSSTTYPTRFNLTGHSLTSKQQYRDFFEVFVGGRRLRKNAIQAYQFDIVDDNGNIIQAIDQDSPAGDVETEKEFDIIVDSQTGEVQLELTSLPGEDEKIVIVRRVGSLWSDPGTALKDTDNSIAEFLRGSISKLPE